MIKIVEILSYKLKNGFGEEFYRVMREDSLPLHKQFKIDVVYHGPSLNDQDNYLLIRCYDSENQMNELLENFYQSHEWKLGPREKIITAIDISLKTLLELPAPAVDALRGAGTPSILSN